MNNILSEKQYQRYILDRLKENGYKETKAIHFDRYYAVDRYELIAFRRYSTWKNGQSS